MFIGRRAYVERSCDEWAILSAKHGLIRPEEELDLFAAWRDVRIPSLSAALSASLAFGLWHIFLTILGIRINERQATGPKIWVAVAGAVLLTMVAGLGLTWLRLHTGGPDRPDRAARGSIR